MPGGEPAATGVFNALTWLPVAVAWLPVKSYHDTRLQYLLVCMHMLRLEHAVSTAAAAGMAAIASAAV
jgi:hypothetical protein